MPGQVGPITIDMRELWPFPPGRTFVYDTGGHIRQEWLEDRSRFTVRHIYYPDDPARYPTEDVMVWRATKLCYTDTYVCSFKMDNAGAELRAERPMDGRGTDDICCRRLVGGVTVSCPYTDRVVGGPVGALRLEGTTCGNLRRRFWKEEHFFWRDPSHGWICIASHGCVGKEDRPGHRQHDVHRPASAAGGAGQRPGVRGA